MALRRPPTRWIVVAAVLVAIGGILALWRARPTEVIAEPVRRGRAIEAIYATGTVEPQDRVAIKATIADRVAEVLVAEGDQVVAGQRLARIASPVRAYALSQSQTELARARRQAGPDSPRLAALEAQARALRAQLDLARVEVERARNLHARGAIARRDLDTAHARLQELAAQHQAAEDEAASMRLELRATRERLASEVQSLASELDESVVIAPMAGTILRREVEPGQVVAPNDVMFEIADVGVLRVELRVDEADIARVVEGTPVALSFYAFPGRAFAGTVREILPEPDRVRRAYTVKVELDRPPPALRIGMTAEANLIVQRNDDALLIPAEALDGDHAWFAERGRATRRPVVVGIRALTHAEVVRGARAGDLAIVDAETRDLEEGARVRPRVTSP
jgi:multidrug efflux pump subunit AcrA (membrane-fusion protein)